MSKNLRLTFPTGFSKSPRKSPGNRVGQKTSNDYLKSSPTKRKCQNIIVSHNVTYMSSDEEYENISDNLKDLNVQKPKGLSKSFRRSPRNSADRKVTNEHLKSSSTKRTCQNTVVGHDVTHMNSGDEYEDISDNSNDLDVQKPKGLSKSLRKSPENRAEQKKTNEYSKSSPTKRTCQNSNVTHMSPDDEYKDISDNLKNLNIQQPKGLSKSFRRSPRNSADKKVTNEHLKSSSTKRTCQNTVVSRNVTHLSSGDEYEDISDNLKDLDVQKPKGLSKSLRRTPRIKVTPKKFKVYLKSSLTKRTCQNNTSSDDENEDISDNMKDLVVQKPKALFSDGDVEGRDMFKFKSRHAKCDLQNKVNTAINNTPKTIDTPIKSALRKVVPATPRQVKEKIKKRILQEVESENSACDYSGSSSDFVPEDSIDESDMSYDSSAMDDDDEEVEEIKTAKTQINKNKDKQYAKESEYFVTPDSYFMMNSSKKITTSDRTLARLKNLNLASQEDTTYISDEHKKKILNLSQSHEHLFDRWLYVMSENCNIILYGIGSKRLILHQLQTKKLKDFPCVVINGYFPSLTIKGVLETIVIDLLENSHVPSNVGDVVNLIETQLNESNTDLFLIIHNIDGTMLRNSKAQTMLANISQIKKVHTIATIDHINAPLLWDQYKLSKFMFTWWDVTTFMPYTEETSFENSMMSHRSGTMQISSLKSVYESLTSNAKGIFKIIIQYQLDNHKQTHYQGLPFRDLYTKSREQFLVSSDMALRAHLTEFLDHKLVKMKRTIYDGSENLLIPIENVLLQQFLEEQIN